MPRRYPALGPLLGKAFDVAVSLTLERWFWLALVTLIVVAGVPWGNVSTLATLYLASAIWGIVSGEAAVRSVRPDFKMTVARVGRLITLNLTINFFAGIATLALIIPGIYVAAMWSLSNAILLLDDTTTGEARRRSWQIVSGNFWRTLLLTFCITLAQLAAGFVAEIVAILGLTYLVQSHWLTLTQQQIGNLGAALQFPVQAYAMVAGWLAYIYWYKTLQGVEQPQERTAGLAPAPA